MRRIGHLIEGSSSIRMEGEVEPLPPVAQLSSWHQLGTMVVSGLTSGTVVLLLLHALAPHPEGSRLGAVPAESSSVGGRSASRVPVGAPAEVFRPEAPMSCGSRSAAQPSGIPVKLSCGNARRIVGQVRAGLALPAHAPEPESFALSLADWLDPHGLWSAAPDSPASAVARNLAKSLLAELEEAPESPAPCSAVTVLAETLSEWVQELRLEFDRGRTDNLRVSRRQAFELAKSTPFEDESVRRAARHLAADLGHRTRVFGEIFGDEGKRIAAVARDRFVPALSVTDWSGMVLTAAVRAYVAAVDPHGLWAPLEEEFAIYAAESGDWGGRLWGEMIRTAVGVRILGAPAEPLAKDDVVLSVGGVVTAGLSVEETEQLGLLVTTAESGEPLRRVTVLRAGHTQPLELQVAFEESDALRPAAPLGWEKVAFGRGNVLIVAVPEVPEELGESLAQTLAHADSATLGVLIDLRGNGGGSTDGAAAAIGVFLPGVPSFPARKRDGSLEILRAMVPPAGVVYNGPLAVVMDGQTASAAEMIASALHAYRRAPLLGTRTFGKGCIQEYFDDLAGVGVLRLTTMLFAEPDGSPIQGVGLEPDIEMNLGIGTPQREADLRFAAPSWAGPDVRDVRVPTGPTWPGHSGRVGPCRDPVLCVALRRVVSGVSPGEGRGASSTAAADAKQMRRVRAGMSDHSPK